MHGCSFPSANMPPTSRPKLGLFLFQKLYPHIENAVFLVRMGDVVRKMCVLEHVWAKPIGEPLQELSHEKPESICILNSLKSSHMHKIQDRISQRLKLTSDMFRTSF